MFIINFVDDWIQTATSDMGSNRSTNWATTSARILWQCYTYLNFDRKNIHLRVPKITMGSLQCLFINASEFLTQFGIYSDAVLALEGGGSVKNIAMPY